MSVVRELVARLGFQVDTKGFKQAEKALEGVRKRAERTGDAVRRSDSFRRRVAGAEAEVRRRGLQGGHLRIDEQSDGSYTDRNGRRRDTRGRFIGKGGAAAAGGAAAGAVAGGGGDVLGTLGKLAATAGLTHVLEGIVELGSRAEETQNVLKSVFGEEGGAQVTEWADRTAVAVGRSKYALAEMAGQLGAVAAPMLGNEERAREMSESYTQLAVDMASFYNTTDKDALAALRSAMTGEVESIKRYGVVMNEATMQEYARTQGINKKVSQMTIAEKTELRYGYIMKTTAAAQGDATRTGDGYANSIKRVKAMMTDFGTDMGRAVLPKIEKLLIYARDGIKAFQEFTKGTWLLESAMWTLSGIAGVLALQLLAPWILPAIAIAALILLIDDLYQLFTGGESAIGSFIDAVFGLGATETMVSSLSDAWEWLVKTFTELRETMPDLIGIFEMLQGAGEDYGWQTEQNVKALLDFIETIQRLPELLGRKLAGFLGIKVEQEDAEGRARERGLGSDVMSRGEELEAIQRDRGERVRAGVQQRDVLRQARRSVKELTVNDIEAEGFALSAAATTVSAPASSAAGGAAPVVQQTNHTSIHINGGDLARVRKVVQDELNANNRRAAAATPRPGGA